MTQPRNNDRITPQHRARKAVVYLRQSSMRQVRENKESQHLQRALADVVREQGWTEVETIDCDLGMTASIRTPPRDGFDRLSDNTLVPDRPLGGTESDNRIRSGRTPRTKTAPRGPLVTPERVGP